MNTIIKLRNSSLRVSAGMNTAHQTNRLYPSYHEQAAASTLINTMYTITTIPVQDTRKGHFSPFRPSLFPAYLLWLALPFLLLCSVAGYASDNNTLPKAGDDISGSPRFLVKQGDDNAFHLRSTTVQANVVGVIADVLVRQVYENKGKSPVEATYIFPASTRAAVYGMSMTVGNRRIKAVIKEKEQARAEYTAAIRQGKAASLLEQLKPNIFQMNVGNILGGDSVVVELRYTEAIVATEGVYEFVYPGVVGPRYVSGVNASEYDAVMSGRDMPKEVPGSFDITTTLSTGVPVKDIQSPSHDIQVQQFDARSNATVAAGSANALARVSLNNNTLTNNRDYILRYRLTGRAIESGLLLSKSNDENYFMLMVQPPRNVEIPNIVPREFVFIVDVSGSMWGFPLDVSRSLMDKLFTTLRPTDKFNILLFSGGSQTLAENSVPATPENIEKARSFMKSNFGGGGTELLPALKRAFAMKTEPSYSRSFVVISDGFVTVEREAFDLVRKSLNKANIYAFGIGPSVNRYIMEGLAHAGKAEAMIVSNAAEAPAMAERFREYIEAPVLSNITVNWGNMQVYDVDPPSIPDATSKRPIVVFGKWKGEASGNLQLSGSAADGAYTFSVDVAAQPLRPEHDALRYLWARNRIAMIEEGATNNSWYGGSSPSEAEQRMITDLGLRYNLLTKYTSFIAVDSVISVKKEDVAKVTLKDTIIFLDKDGTVLKTVELDSSYRHLPIRAIAKEQGLKEDIQWEEVSRADTAHLQHRPFPSVLKFVNIGLEKDSTKPNVTVTANGPTIFCEGDSVTLTASAGFSSYSWSNGSTVIGDSRNLRVKKSGNYKVTVRNDAGRSVSSTPTKVRVNPQPAATTQASSNIAYGDSLTLTAPNTKGIGYSGTDTLRGNYWGSVQDGSSANPTVLPESPKPTITPSVSGKTYQWNISSGNTKDSKAKSSRKATASQGGASATGGSQAPQAKGRLSASSREGLADKEDIHTPESGDVSIDAGATVEKAPAEDGAAPGLQRQRLNTNTINNNRLLIADSTLGRSARSNEVVNSGSISDASTSTLNNSQGSGSTLNNNPQWSLNSNASLNTTTINNQASSSQSGTPAVTVPVPNPAAVPTTKSLPAAGSPPPRVVPQTAPRSTSTERAVQSTADLGEITFEDETVDPLVPGRIPPRTYWGFTLGSNHARFSDYDYLSRAGEQLHPSANFSLALNGGLSTEILLGDPKNSKQSIIAELTYDKNKALYPFAAHTPAFKEDNMQVSTALAQYRMQMDFSRLSMRLFYRFNLGNTNFGLRVGTSLSYLLGSDIEESATLPDGFVWVQPGGDTCDCMEVQGKKAIFARGAMPSLNKFQVGLAGGLQYEFILRRFSLVPNLTFEYPLTSLSSDVSRRMLIYKLGLSFLFHL